MANDPALILKTFDTFPAWLITLSDVAGPIPLFGNVTAVKICGRGQNTATLLGEDTCTVITENSLTATSTQGSPQLTAVSTFTGIATNTTLVGATVPPNAVVGTFNSGTGIINMVAAGSITLDNPTGTPVNATAGGSSIAFTANRGMVLYAPTITDTATADDYACEFPIHWTAGGVQKVPNEADKNPIIQIDASIIGSGE